MIRSALFSLLLTGTISFPASSADTVSGAPASSITAEELRGHIYFLASDFLDGRAPGTQGYSAASAYVASQFRAAGLDEIAENAIEGNKYYLEIPVMQRSLRNFRLNVSSPEGKRSFPLGGEFKIQIFDYSRESGGKWPLVFAGYGISEPQAGWDDLEGLDLAGKAVVLLRDAPSRNGEPVLPPELDERYRNPGSIFERIAGIAKSKPAAIIIPASGRFLEQWAQRPDEGFWPKRILLENGRPYYHWIHAELPNFLLVGSNIFIAKDSLINELFFSADYRPFLSDGSVNEDGYRSFQAEDTFIEPSYEFAEEQRNSSSVVSVARGSDPVLRDEFILIGAHLDHLEGVGGQVMNGADDNASGVAGLIEIAEAIAMAPKRRSVIFAAFTEEESGLFGSRHFAQNCPVPVDRIVAYVNFDMIGRTHPDLEATGGVFVSGADRTCIEYWDKLREINERTEKLDLNLRETLESVRRSDQFSFYMNGIPTLGLESGAHPDTHRPTDDPEKIEFDKVRKISRLVYEFVSALADADGRPCDSPPTSR